MKIPSEPIESVGIEDSAATTSDEENTNTSLITTFFSFIDPPFMRRLTTKFSDRTPARSGARGRKAPAQKVMVRARAPALYGSQARALYRSRFAATHS